MTTCPVRLLACTPQFLLPAGCHGSHCPCPVAAVKDDLPDGLPGVSSTPHPQKHSRNFAGRHQHENMPLDDRQDIMGLITAADNRRTLLYYINMTYKLINKLTSIFYAKSRNTILLFYFLKRSTNTPLKPSAFPCHFKARMIFPKSTASRDAPPTSPPSTSS